MHCSDLKLLLQKYAKAESREEVYIKRTLEGIAELFAICDESEYYYADMITRNFCRVIDVMEKQHQKEMTIAKRDYRQERCSAQFTCDRDLARAFYNYFKEPEQVDYLEVNAALEAGRKDLVHPTMKDYVARIYTFSGPKYLGELFPLKEITHTHPVLFTYENIELILATFQTRNEKGEIVKQRVNIRSALRKLNEFKQRTMYDGTVYCNSVTDFT